MAEQQTSPRSVTPAPSPSPLAQAGERGLGLAGFAPPRDAVERGPGGEVGASSSACSHPEQLDAALELRPASITLDYLELYGLRPAVERVQAAGIVARVGQPACAQAAANSAWSTFSCGWAARFWCDPAACSRRCRPGITRP